MAQKKKRLTQREKDLNAKAKRELQEEGFLPPDKPRLNRKKFAAQVVPEFAAMDVYTADYYLRKAIHCMVAEQMHEVTLEQVGVLKLLKIAVESKKFSDMLKEEGRTHYTIGEYVDKVVLPIVGL